VLQSPPIKDYSMSEKKSQRIEPRLLKGFRDYLPSDMQPRQAMIRTIGDVFERFGFGPLQTPALEYTDVLLGQYGADAEKLLYRFEDNGGRDICLRYDLTVPLSRVAAQYGDLPKPFKRYQIAPVWRAEKPGRGRFREFYQCDADIVGSPSLIYDAECIALDYAVMQALRIDNVEICFSTRKLLGALGAALGVADEDQLATIFRTIDKLPSQGRERVVELLASEADCSPAQIDTILRFIEIEGDNDTRLTAVHDVLGTEADQAVSELRQVLAFAVDLGVPADILTLDFSIARGLDYYTGTVYETFLRDLPGFGSVMSGGRYDTLISRFIGKDMPAVGISVGIDRLFAGLIELGNVGSAESTITVMVAALGDDCVRPALQLVSMLRSAGIAAETAFDSVEGGSMKKQLKAANRKAAPFVAILGSDEVAAGKVALRDMTSGEQSLVGTDELLARLT
jgi:histidyl-tRNA synthetase